MTDSNIRQDYAKENPFGLAYDRVVLLRLVVAYYVVLFAFLLGVGGGIGGTVCFIRRQQRERLRRRLTIR